MKKNLMAMMTLSSVLAASPMLTSCVDSNDAIESLRETEALTKRDNYIKAVYANYNEAYNNLENSQRRKLGLNNDLENLKNGLASVENLANKQIAYYQAILDVETAKLETYNAFRMAQDNELKKKVAELDVKQDEAYNKRVRAEKAVKDVYELRTSRGTYNLLDINDVYDIVNDAKMEPLALLKAAYILDKNFEPTFYSESFYSAKYEDLCKHMTYYALYINYNVINSFKANKYDDLTNREKALFDDCYETLNSYSAKREYEDMVSAAKAAGEAYDEAYFAYDKAYAEYNAAKNLLYNLVNVSSEISDCESNIENAVSRINAYKNKIFNEKEMIEMYSYELKFIEEKIAIERRLVANWAERIKKLTGDVLPTEPVAPQEPEQPKA